MKIRLTLVVPDGARRGLNVQRDKKGLATRDDMIMQIQSACDALWQDLEDEIRLNEEWHERDAIS